MAEIPAWMLRHEVTVEAYAGTNGFGAPTYAAAVTERALVDEGRKLVRAPTGDEVISEATVFLRLAATAPPESRITLPSGRVATVISAKRRDGGGLPVADHLELAVT
jgi:hypothetical protein